MSKIHPREMELARFSEQEPTSDVAAHVRGCARCRSVAAEYGWLGGEVGAALAAAAAAVPVPRPEWRVVREHLVAPRRRVAGWRVSAVAGVVLAFCLMLSLPPVLGTAGGAPKLPPRARVAPVPATAVASVEHLAPVLTPTPVVFHGEAAPLTPAFMLPPTPPEPEI